MGLLEKRLWKFDNIHVLLQMRQKVWKSENVSPNNLYKLHFWDNLYKLHPWLQIVQSDRQDKLHCIIFFLSVSLSSKVDISVVYYPIFFSNFAGL